jgi:threonine/homoserine/homoserine lactone efflux protein
MNTEIYTFCTLVALLTITPGADTMIVLENTVRAGRGAGYMTSFGVASGLLVHAGASALGLAIVLARSATLFGVVKTVGALYLVWLGIRAIVSANEPHAREVARGLPVSEGRRCYLEGLLSNVLNPKVAIFYLALLPQFIDPGDPVLATSMMLASIHAAMGIVWLGVVSTTVARSRRVLARPGVRRLASRLSGAVLVALGLRLAFARR